MGFLASCDWAHQAESLEECARLFYLCNRDCGDWGACAATIFYPRTSPGRLACLVFPKQDFYAHFYAIEYHTQLVDNVSQISSPSRPY